MTLFRISTMMLIASTAIACRCFCSLRNRVVSSQRLCVCVCVFVCVSVSLRMVSCAWGGILGYHRGTRRAKHHHNTFLARNNRCQSMVHVVRKQGKEGTTVHTHDAMYGVGSMDPSHVYSGLVGYQTSYIRHQTFMDHHYLSHKPTSPIPPCGVVHPPKWKVPSPPVTLP